MTFNEWVCHFHLDYESLATRCNSDDSKNIFFFFLYFSIDLIDDDGPLTQLLCDSALPSHDDNFSVQLGTQPTALIGFVWLLIVIVLRRRSQIKQVRKRGQVAARATVGYHAVPVRSTKANELFCFVENDTQKMVRKKEKKKLRATGAKKGQSSSHWLLLSDCTYR